MSKIDTLCVHAGYTPGRGEPRQMPIVQSTTFKYETMVAARINALEGGVGAILTSSGQAANLFACLNICQAGDHIVSLNNIYGGTFNLLGVSLKQMGIDVTFVDHKATDEEVNACFPVSVRRRSSSSAKRSPTRAWKCSISSVLQRSPMRMACRW